MTSNGQLLFVSNSANNTVSVVDVSGDASNDKVIGKLMDPASQLAMPAGLAISADGKTLYIAGQGQFGVGVANISGVSLSSPGAGSVSGSLIEGAGTAGTFGLAIAPDGDTLFASNSQGGSSVAVIDLSGDASSGQVVGTITDPASPFSSPTGLAISPNGAQLYVLNVGTAALDSVAIPPAFTALAISGTLKVGTPVTAALTGLPTTATGVTYQWYQGTTAISGATSSTFTPELGQAGQPISVAASAHAVGYSAQTLTSSAVTVPLLAITASTPTISGRASVGKTLKLKLKSWKPAGIKLKYQWYAGGKAIKGATHTSLKLTRKLVGKKITIKVTGTKAGYKTLTKASKATKKVAKNPE